CNQRCIRSRELSLYSRYERILITMVASFARCPLDTSAEQIVRFIIQLPAASYPALLDSCSYHHYGLYDGRYLIAAYNPALCLQAIGDETYEFSRQAEQITRGGVLARLDELLAGWRSQEDSTKKIPCSGG